MSENLNLKNTIVLPDPSDATQTKEFNINAVYSDEAGKVTNPLLIRQSGNTDSDVEFDGSLFRDAETGEVLSDENGKPVQRVIDYVPTAGGKFTGHVQIHENNEAISGIGKSEIINYGQVETLIKNLKGAPLWKWNKNDGYTSINNPNTSAPYMLNTIIGSETDFQYLVQALEGIQSEYASDSWPITCSYTGESSELKEYLTQLKPEYYEDSTVVIRGKIKYNSDEDRPTAIGFGIDYDTLVITPFMTATSTTGAENKVDTVYILPGAKEIRSLAFSGCTNLKKIFIPGSVELIASDAFNGSGLTDIYYTGTEAEWNRIKGYHYEFTDNADTGEKSASVKFEDIHPLDSLTGVTRHFVPLLFLYICKEVGETDTSLTSNKMFLKLPGEKSIEISKGAVRLNSAVLNSESYYTYEGLAEIIARINKRLDAIGIGVSTTALAPLHTVEEVNSLVPEVEVTDDFDPDSVPSILDLQSDIKSVTLDETTVKLTEDLYTFYNIGKITGASMLTKKKVAEKGDTLKDVFNAIFGVQEDAQPTVTNNSSLSISAGITSYGGGEYGTRVEPTDVTITFTLNNSGTAGFGYRCVDDTKITDQNAKFYYSVTKQNSADIKITLPEGRTALVTKGACVSQDSNILYCDFDEDTKQVSIQVSLPEGSVTDSQQTRYGSIEARVDLGQAQKEDQLTAGTAIDCFLTFLEKDATDISKLDGGDKSKTAGPYTISAGSKYTYYAVTSDTSVPTSWTRYNQGTTSVTDLSISADAGQYVWIASAGNYVSIYAFNEVSGKYNTDQTPTTKISNQTLKNAQNKDVSGYTFYRTTNPKALPGTVKYKLA